MGTRHGIDAVELHKPKPLDQCQQIRALGRARWVAPAGRGGPGTAAARLGCRAAAAPSAPFQRVAIRNGRGQRDVFFNLSFRVFQLCGNDLCRLAPDFQAAGIHSGQLPGQTLQQFNPVKTG